MVTVTSLTKDYATPRGPLRVLDDVNLSLEPGDAAAVTGPSGSGKSTLLYILGALEAPSAGTVLVDGKNPHQLGVDGLARFRNRQVGFVFQDHCLLPQLSVLENVLVPTLVASDAEGNTASNVAFARELIDEVGLGARIEHRPAALSGGERQRVALARALIRKPRLVLCDEPTGNLDADSAAVVTELLLAMVRRRNAILLVVTHSHTLAAAMSVRFELGRGHLTRVGG